MNNKQIFCTRLETRNCVLKSQSYSINNNNVTNLLFSDQIFFDKESPFIFFSYSHSNIRGLLRLLSHNTFNYIHIVHINLCTLSRYNYKKISSFINKNRQNLDFIIGKKRTYVGDEFDYYYDNVSSVNESSNKNGAECVCRKTNKYLYSIGIDIDLYSNNSLKTSHIKSKQFKIFLNKLTNKIDQIDISERCKKKCHTYHNTIPSFLFERFKTITLPKERFDYVINQNNEYSYERLHIIRETENFKKWLPGHIRIEFGDIRIMIRNSVRFLHKIFNIKKRIRDDHLYGNIIYNIHDYIIELKNIEKKIVDNVLYVYDYVYGEYPPEYYAIELYIKELKSLKIRFNTDDY